MKKKYDVVIVGAGFTGLTAALEISKAGLKVCVLESEAEPGGLAGTFDFKNGARIEKFYHHWFTNDLYVPGLIKELGLEENVLYLPSKTGMFFNNQFWKLSTPMDLLKFRALSFIDRIRLGLLVFQARLIRNWKKIEHLSIREWLEPICGKNVYKVVWEPLINAKFSSHAEDITAVWFWKKLVLRGGTRNKKGQEQLAYFRGGFSKLSYAMVDAIKTLGGEVIFNSPVLYAVTNDNLVTGLQTARGLVSGSQVLLTPAFSLIADIFSKSNSCLENNVWLNDLRKVKYLGNACLVLQLKHSLSGIYWLNVNDPGFPFVGVIEHTNLDDQSNYQGSHIVYLSRYMAADDTTWKYDDQAYFEYAIPYLKKMFPEFRIDWVIDYKVWRTRYAQAVTERKYSEYVPSETTPYRNAFITTMAQIYPEDRGTNYAIREGRKISEKIIKSLLNNKITP